MNAVFLRALEDENKEAAIRRAINNPVEAKGVGRFEVDTARFREVPRSPFAYWVGDRLRSVFAEQPSFESDGRSVRQGLATADDFRFARMWTEVGPHATGRVWYHFTKGGRFSRIYADVPLVVNWCRDGLEIQNNLNDRGGVRSNVWMLRDTARNFFFRPGVSWPLRGIHFSAQAVPRGCVFSHGGKMAFAPDDDLPWVIAILNSTVFDRFIAFFAGKVGGVQYEVGLIQNLPMPRPSTVQQSLLGRITRRVWSLRHGLDSQAESSHAFVLPVLLQTQGESFVGRSESWAERVFCADTELADLQSTIDEIGFNLYGISDADRQQVELGLRGGVAESDEEDGGAIESVEVTEIDAAPLIASLLSWCVGVSFGRFDLRLATGERAPPPEPEPFDALPVCSPGMLTGDDGLPLVAPPAGYPIDFPRDGILVDDAGAKRDLVARARHVFEQIFDDPAARWEEAAEVLGDRDRTLRGWFASEFFELHIKRYSKSRRKAPIYWQLATPSASYSTWIYYHRFTRDTLHLVLSDHIVPKLQHEERKLTSVTQDAGPNPNASQRKEIDSQETCVSELRAFRSEVARVAPLWNPNLNDGVILNFAPLWRLVPQHRAWQKECKSAWDKLCKEDYDWAHLAMHLWPERVVPKCANDRSLAIAHGLEGIFWREGEDGKWQPKSVSDDEVAGLVSERTSPAVKDALKSLLEAPAAGRGRVPQRKKASTRGDRSAAPSAAPAELRERAPRQNTSTRTVAAIVLDQIRSAIATLGSNAAKSDILLTVGLSASQWSPAINALLADGTVTKTGQKRGTRYHLARGLK